MIARGAWRDARGATAIEFALVAPVFLMFLFLLLDGGRAMFTKQALDELAAATARCAAVDATNCATKTAAQAWAVNRGRARARLPLTTAMVTISTAATCNGRAGMAQATIAMPYAKGAMTLLPQSTLPAKLTAISCFPLAS